MIKNTSLLVLIILLATSCKTNTKETPIDENEKLESNNEWINIFDGTSTDGWRAYN